MSASLQLIDAWAAAMWRASWQGGLAVLTVWTVCRLVPSMPVRFQSWLWRLALVKFMAVLLWPAAIELPLLPAPEPAAWDVGKASVSPPIQGERVAVNRPAEHGGAWLLLFLVWTVVVTFQAIRLLKDYRAVKRMRMGSWPSDDRNLLAQMATASKAVGLRTPPALLEMAGAGSPMLVGLICPAIVMPKATLSRLDDAERVTVLGHELAHVRRRDLWWSLVAAIVRVVFFFHPLAWLSERRLHVIQESAADELAMELQREDPVRYATLLVSIVGKLGPSRLLPSGSVGAVGAHQSLKQRFLAMRLMKPVSRRVTVAYTIALAMAATLGLLPWVVVAAEAPVADKPAAKERPVSVRGKFMSFKDNTLTLVANDGVLIKKTIPENAKTFQWNDDGGFKVVGTIETLNQVKAGTWFHVIFGKDIVTIRVGARKAMTTGTLVSFKENRLLILGKDLGASFVKKYGNHVHFNRFRDDVPAYESIDGGAYKLIGTANKVLGNVKEGTILTVHGEGDDNITLVQIGVPKPR